MNYNISPVFTICGMEISTLNWSDDVVNQLIREAITARVQAERQKIIRAERILYKAHDKFERVIHGMNHGLIEIDNQK